MLTSKICKSCKETKSIKLFGKYKSCKDGYRTSCNPCRSTENTNYCRTKDGLITRIYSHQKLKSIKRKYPLPRYTKKELKEWLFSKKLFHSLFKEWEFSNYDINLTPSVDRIDDYKTYMLKNIQLMTWKENNTKAHRDRKSGNNSKINISVVQYSLCGKFISNHHSIADARRITGAGHIQECCAGIGRVKSSGGFIWKYS